MGTIDHLHAINFVSIIMLLLPVSWLLIGHRPFNHQPDRLARIITWFMTVLGGVLAVANLILYCHEGIFVSGAFVTISAVVSPYYCTRITTMRQRSTGHSR